MHHLSEVKEKRKKDEKRCTIKVKRGKTSTAYIMIHRGTNSIKLWLSLFRCDYIILGHI